MKIKLRNKLLKQSEKGFRGYPVATVAYYGPDNSKATKVSVGVIQYEGAEAVMRRWYTNGVDARLDQRLTQEILLYLRQQKAASIAALAKILGCPHEEITDYPEGQVCPKCPYWAGKDRWANPDQE